jgi:asparagine synthase (glutamine-hydrolysing)
MCGIAGIARFDGAPIAEPDLERLRRAGERLAHRGPDGEDIGSWDSVGIAFRRLAVFDVDGGRQPFWNEDHTVGLVVNGTIYNHESLRRRLEPRHRFATASDCEPILHLYEEEGRNLADSLVGMFAFALWDLRRGRVLLGRDRLGLKPLYWSIDRRRLIFGSEIKGLLALPDCPREPAWGEWLADPSMNNAVGLGETPLHSGFEGINQLPGGFLLDVDLAAGRADEHRYWGLPDPDPTLGLEEARRDCRQLLLDSIDCCLTGEAELGLALSGGVDSAVIAGRSGQGRRVNSFTVLTESTRANGDAAGAVAVAEHSGLFHSQVYCDVGRLLLAEPQAWEGLVWRCETPLCSPEQLMKRELFKAARSSVPNLKVMLSGVGGDEFSGGYSTTLVPDQGAGWEDFGAALARLWEREQRRGDPVLGIWDSTLAPGLVRQLSGGRVRSEDLDLYVGFLRHKQRDLLMFNLWCEDRLASAISIEARAPHLDHRLVEMLARIPSDLRPELLWDKRIVREAAAGVLPPDAVARPKVPFFYGSAAHTVFAPFLRLLRADGHALIESALGESPAADFISREKLIRYVDGLEEGRADIAVGVEMVLRLVNLGILANFAKADPPARTETAPAPSFEITDWTDPEGREQAVAAARPRQVDRGESVLKFADGALLVEAQGPTPSHHLAIGGALRYELVAGDPWLDVLRGLDGRASLAELCAEADADLGAVEPYVEICLEEGILVEVLSVGDRRPGSAGVVG